MMKRVGLLSIVLASLAAAPHGQLRPGSAATVSVQLLAINDFHGNLEPPAGTTGRIGSTPAGGVEYLATHVKHAIAENPNSIVVAAGDLVGASPLLSALFRDEPTIEAMNALQLATTSVGNHEFDKGSAALLRLQGRARFQYLSANVVRSGASRGSTLLPATTVRRVGGVNIGFIGETLAGTPRIVLPSGVKGLTFLDEAASANAAAARLKKQGVNAIVLLVHQGGEQTPSTDPNGCQGFHGGIVSILDKLSPDIKVVISGHTHQFYNCTIGERSVTSASSFGRMMTRVNLTIDAARGTIVGVSARNVVVTRDVSKDAAQSRIIAKYGARAAPLANRVVGSANGDILRTLNHAGESALGDLIADAQLAATSPQDKGGAVVAFMNHGGIRTDLIASHQAGGERHGEITYGELFAVQPFNNVLSVFTLSGEAIKRLLEQQFDRPGGAANMILEVSRGFTYRYRLHAPPGQHVEADSIALNGRPITATMPVRIATNDFLVGGGDSFDVLKEGRDSVGGELDIDALSAYLLAHPQVEPGPQDRIVRLD